MMNKLKKILFYMIFILNVVVAFSSEDARIYMPRKTEPAKLKIGVTKLKTKELIFNFSQEKGVFYTKLPETVDEKHDIYLSNTLDKIPAISKTNGRANISNIEKKLKDDITHNSKIKYEIIEVDGVNNIEKGVKYLAINPETVSEEVYI